MQPKRFAAPDRSQVHQRLRDARKALTAAAATLLSLGALTDDDAIAIRHALKVGRSTRSTVRQMQEAIAVCEQLSSHMNARAARRMADDGVGAPTGAITEVSPTRSHASRPERPRANRRRAQPRSLRHVPPAGGIPSSGQSPSRDAASHAHVAVLDRALVGDEDRLLDVGRRMQLVHLVEAGSSIRAALRKVGLEPTSSRRRWAQRLIRRWKNDMSPLDQRWIRRSKPTVVTPLVESIILRIWNGRRGASVAAVHREVEKAIKALHADAVERGVPCDVEVPAYPTVQKYLKRLPESMKLVRASGMAGWDKQGRMVVTYDPADYANHWWQIDHTRLDIWVRVETAPGVWEPAEVWLTAVIDVYSRAIMGWWLAARPPNAWTTALVMRHAILPKEDPTLPLCGLPLILAPDHGADFMSHRVALLMQGLGVRLEPTPPYYPNMKGEIERWFRTLNGYLAQLAGAMDNEGRSLGAARLRVPYLLTVTQLRSEIRGFIADYHQRAHSATGETPIQRWQRTVRLSLPTVEEVNVLMLHSDQTRVVTNQGISFHVDGRGGNYLAEELQHHWRSRVRIRYNPEDLDSILVYESETGDYICEAWLEGVHYSVDDVKRWRRGAREQLKRRTTAYVEEMLKDDRRSARAWDEAHARADRLRTIEQSPEVAAREAGPEREINRNVDRFLQRFRNRDRNRGAS